MAHPVELYLSQLADVRGSGAGLPEVSGYTALANLFDSVGATLKPKVTAVIQLANSGAGHPDGAFFTPDQLRGGADEGQLFSSHASRGVVEVKAPADDLVALSKSEQVRKYLQHYGQILLTNYRAFVCCVRRNDPKLSWAKLLFLTRGKAA
jgi:hypothetical protein